MKKSLTAKLIVLILCTLPTLIVPNGYGRNAVPTPASLPATKDKISSGVLFRPVNVPFLSPEKTLAEVRLTFREQQPAAPSSSLSCPQLVIACPLYIVEQDTQLRFSALVAGHDPNAALAYTWSLSSGTINEGQRTSTITVDTAGLGGRRITATVAVRGLAEGCQNMASCAIYVAKPKEARRLDAYGDLAFNLEKRHLSIFATALRDGPDLQGYIIVYGGRCSAETEAQERAERAKDWLINQHGIDASRIVAIDGGYRETLATHLFIGTIDATLPELTGSARPLDQSRCK